MNRIVTMTVTLLSLALSEFALAQGEDWPRTVNLDEGTVTVYQPQVEALDDDTLYYRAALALRPTADAEPVFGTGWLKAPVDIDQSRDLVHPSRLELTQTRFPDGTADMEAEIATALLTQSPAWDLDFPVAELEAALDAAEAESLAAQKLKTAPPKIIYRDQPALLVTIDGEPVQREIENSPYRAVINTPFPLITDGDDFYLNAAKGVWYRAKSATGPYRFDAEPPADIVRMVEDAGDQAQEESAPEEAAREPVTAANAPEIVVSTVPAELIVTEGPADFVPLVDDLLVLHNSDDDVFLHVGEQKYYVVLAGRWYRSSSLEGPWEYQASDALPTAFAKIPDDSPQADSRVYVAGTPEAEEAVLDAQVPQTAAVRRGEVDIDVAYDGDPDFERVEGTRDLRYARNTGATVLESDRTYYLLEDGVWYVSSSPHGPWVVSDHRPGEIDSIEPSSPVYNTKYVYVYDATPEVVYVGYTPGYFGSYIYGPTIVYGTGWHYRPWVSSYHYYPRFHTWGYHVAYSDWGGWTFGLGWYWPSYSLNYYYGGYWHHHHPWHSRHWGYWGPRGYAYRPYYGRHGYYGHRHHDRGHYKGYGKAYRYHDRHDKYARGDYGSWDRDYDRRDRYDRERNRNLYRDEMQRARVALTRDRWDEDRNRPGDRGQRGDRVGSVAGRNPAYERRLVDSRKIRESTTGPVRPSDLRSKADLRDTKRTPGLDRGLVSPDRDETIVTPGRDREAVARRDAENIGSQRSAETRKVRESRPEPISQGDLRARAAARNDKVRESRPEPISQGDLRARATVRDDARAVPSPRPDTASPGSTASVRAKARRDNRPTPITREDLRQRGDSIARRNDGGKPSVNRPLPEPSRALDRSRRQVTSPARRVAPGAPEVRPSRHMDTPSRQVEQRAPRREARAAPAPREIAPPTARQRLAPARPMSREPSRPLRAAPAPRPEQRSAPRPQQRSAPRAEPRNAPRQQREAERSSPRRERGKARERRRHN